ncbi:hypothetical protein JOH51_007546 [Rhizobium leguminosarum]|nr:hypothetical protein [Rhizobium leguminosarum]
MLHLQHQFNQFVLRQPLQITSIHHAMESGISSSGKGVGNYDWIAIRTQPPQRRHQMMVPIQK